MESNYDNDDEMAIGSMPNFIPKIEVVTVSNWFRTGELNELVFHILVCADGAVSPTRGGVAGERPSASAPGARAVGVMASMRRLRL